MTTPNDTTVTAGPAADPEAVLEFPAGLPGFPGARAFRAERWGGDTSPFVLLTCTTGVAARFVIVPAGVFFPEYHPELDGEALRAVGLDDQADADLWVILTLGSCPEEATANLLGPLVLHTAAGLAVQAVLPGRRWSPRTPLVAG